MKLTEMELSQVVRYGKGFEKRSEQTIKQILENQEKAEKYDELISRGITTDELTKQLNL